VRAASRTVSQHGIDQPRPITGFAWAAIVAVQLEEEEL
jgi:hypothetical protein